MAVFYFDGQYFLVIVMLTMIT